MDEFSINEAYSEDFLPTGKKLWKVGAALLPYLRNRRFLTALYGEGRESDIMYRYLSGQTLEEIGRVYDLSRERIRQLCVKYLRRLIYQITHYTKDVVDYKVDNDTQAMLKDVRSEINNDW